MLGRTLVKHIDGSLKPVLHRCFATPRRLTTLERRIGDNIGTDEAAFERGHFDGSVYPDLPVIGPAMAEDIEEEIKRRVENASPRQGLVVRTVAAQCLDGDGITQKIDRAGNLFRGSRGVRGALLCVSGGDHERNSGKPGLKDSRFILSQAASMKSRGDIPDGLDLWAVANPMTDSVDSFRWKVDAGARCFLTQPPFLRVCSQSWFERVAEQATRENIDILVGVPIITSKKNLEFWLDLCGVNEGPEALALKSSFPSADDGVKTSSASYNADEVIQWNVNFMRDVALKMPGVTGMHVMPVTARGLEMMQQVMLLADER